MLEAEIARFQKLYKENEKFVFNFDFLNNLQNDAPVSCSQSHELSYLLAFGSREKILASKLPSSLIINYSQLQNLFLKQMDLNVEIHEKSLQKAV